MDYAKRTANAIVLDNADTPINNTKLTDPLERDLDVSNFYIFNLPNPVYPSEIMSKSYCDDLFNIEHYVKNPLVKDLNTNTNRIINLGETNGEPATSLSTKKYADDTLLFQTEKVTQNNDLFQSPYFYNTFNKDNVNQIPEDITENIIIDTSNGVIPPQQITMITKGEFQYFNEAPLNTIMNYYGNLGVYQNNILSYDFKQDCSISTKVSLNSYGFTTFHFITTYSIPLSVPITEGERIGLKYTFWSNTIEGQHEFKIYYNNIFCKRHF